ncbi:MAG: hypothetical protein ACE5HT_16850 [Gemmatimonadales bacterium]
MSDRARSVTNAALSILMIVVGGLLALFCGGCSVLFTGVMIASIVQNGLGNLWGFEQILPFVAPGLAIAWGGIVMIRHGIARWKA